MSAQIGCRALKPLVDSPQLLPPPTLCSALSAAPPPASSSLMMSGSMSRSILARSSQGTRAHCALLPATRLTMASTSSSGVGGSLARASPSLRRREEGRVRVDARAVSSGGAHTPCAQCTRPDWRGAPCGPLNDSTAALGGGGGRVDSRAARPNRPCQNAQRGTRRGQNALPLCLPACGRAAPRPERLPPPLLPSALPAPTSASPRSDPPRGCPCGACFAPCRSLAARAHLGQRVGARAAFLKGAARKAAALRKGGVVAAISPPSDMAPARRGAQPMHPSGARGGAVLTVLRAAVDDSAWSAAAARLQRMRSGGSSLPPGGEVLTEGFN